MKAVFALAAFAALAVAAGWALRDGGAAQPEAPPAPVKPLALPGGPAALPATLAAMAPAASEPVSAAALAGAPPAQALRRLVSCFAANSCNTGRRGAEGLDEHFEIVAAVLAQLDRLVAQGDTAEQAAWARELLAFPDGHVQAQALALAAKLPPSAETTAAAVTALGRIYDAVLLAQAYPVLQRWQQLGLSSGYDDMFVGLVHTGGWRAAQSVAENVGPFLNAGNVGRFEQVARQLPAGARQQALLRSLRDHELQRQGG
ncbi:hypothetical protein [Roseateles sp.]|uniref:hypothetical protein n=1 Tax=Roseateles sp. TaxID=1971397 RepID=UPI003266A954